MLEYEGFRAGLFVTLLVDLSMLRMCSTYGGELINEDSVLRGGCFEITRTKTIIYAKHV